MQWSWPVLTLLACSFSAAFGQAPLGEAYWQAIRAKADSVVMHRFGADFFHRHIFRPHAPLDYCTSGGNTTLWADLATISRVPDRCYFEYDIGLDSLRSSPNNLRIALTPDGERVPPSLEPLAEWEGFVDCGGDCRFAHDLKGFMALAKANGVKCRRKNAFREMRWIPPDSAARADGAYEGRYELILGRYLGKRYARTSSGHFRSYWCFDAIVFDPFSGAVLRKEEREEVYMVLTPPGSL